MNDKALLAMASVVAVAIICMLGIVVNEVDEYTNQKHEITCYHNGDIIYYKRGVDNYSVSIGGVFAFDGIKTNADCVIKKMEEGE